MTEGEGNTFGARWLATYELFGPKAIERDICRMREQCFRAKLGGMKTLSLDNRGLPPPEPMTRILEAIQPLESDDELHVLMDREPLLLYPELERRGFAWEFSEQAEDFLLVIRRGG